jgi:hypothetical protein
VELARSAWGTTGPHERCTSIADKDRPGWFSVVARPSCSAIPSLAAKVWGDASGTRGSSKLLTNRSATHSCTPRARRGPAPGACVLGE